MAPKGPVGKTVACPVTLASSQAPHLIQLRLSSINFQDREELAWQTSCLLCPLDKTKWLAFILPLSAPHTHTRIPHTASPPPCRDTATSPPSTPPPKPFPSSPKHRMLQARLSRADKADALGNSARA